jgi:hypothetical protein
MTAAPAFNVPVPFDWYVKGILFLFVALIGGLFHYYRKWLADETPGPFNRYIAERNPRYIGLSALTIVGATIGVLFGGQLDSITWTQLVTLAFTTGVTVDAIIAKGDTGGVPESRLNQSSTELTIDSKAGD